MFDISLPMLTKLRTLHAASKDALRPDALKGFWSLPTLKSFRTRHYLGDASNDFGSDVFSVQNIDLTCSTLSDVSIRSLVQSCKSLQSFKVILAFGLDKFDFSVATEGFAKHKDTLKVLVIDIEDVMIDHITPLKSLKAMEKLPYLDLPQHAFYLSDHSMEPPKVAELHRVKGLRLADLLPSSLETWIIRLCNYSILYHKWNVSTYRGSTFSKLKSSLVVYTDADHDYLDNDSWFYNDRLSADARRNFVKLKGAFEDAGIALENQRYF
ncbi:MAG: hypothetical protein MMC23_003755 [Stictis urceolatum]|nr:hypothetical protein [Stictis urceolata]